MGRLAKRFPAVNLVVAVVLLAAAGGGLWWRQRQMTGIWHRDPRPAAADVGRIFDYAGALAERSGPLEAALAALEEERGIAAVVVTAADPPAGEAPAALAGRLLERWQVGSATGNRGLLLLAVTGTQVAALAATPPLEDLFPPEFRARVEGLLGDHLARGLAAEGLAAALAAIGQRAARSNGGQSAPAAAKRPEDRPGTGP